MVGKSKGFRAFIQEKLPTNWEIALREQRSVSKYVEAVYYQIARRYNTKEGRYLAIQSIFKNVECQHPDTILGVDEIRRLRDFINFTELNDRVDVLNYYAK